MKDGPRYVTIRDYLQVVRRYRLMIVVVVIAFAAAAYALSSGQKKEYQAEAALSFADSSQDSDLFGLDSAPNQTSEERAAVNAEAVTRPTTAARVKRRLRLHQSVDDLQTSVSARAEARTNLVVIQARAGQAALAARIANGFARETRARLERRQRRRYAQAAAQLRKRFRTLKKQSRDSFSRAVFAERISRIEALQDFAAPAQIVRRAEAPDAPASPRPLRDGFLGALLGLALGLVAAFLRDALDRRMRGSAEIEREFELPLLGQVSREAMGRVAFSVNGRDKLSPPDMEAFRILRTNLDLLEPRQAVRSVLVTSALPEEGKSTVAGSLATASAVAGRRTLMIESDLRRPTLAKRLGIAQRPGLSDLLAGTVELREAIQTIALHGPGTESNNAATHPAETLDCITAGTPSPRPAEVLDSDRMRALLSTDTVGYDLVVLDTSPLLPVADTLELLPHVDATLICVRASTTTREDAKAAKSVLERVPPRTAGLVVTGVKGSDRSAYGYYSYKYAYAEKV
jgi:capsular exopolysaccharide synthesis family protein